MSASACQVSTRVLLGKAHMGVFTFGLINNAYLYVSPTVESVCDSKLILKQCICSNYALAHLEPQGTATLRQLLGNKTGTDWLTFTNL